MSKCFYRNIIIVTMFLISCASQASTKNNYSFGEIYDVPIWQNDYAIWGTILVVSAGAAAFTTMTAGTGAPLAATGVSTLASALVGGGAGSYMAGLSMVGGLVGGNAIVGAAMLNAGSVALIGGTALKSIPTVAIVSIETIRFLGPAILVPEEGKKEINFIISIPPTSALGTERVKKLIERNEDTAKKLLDKEITRDEADKEYRNIANEALYVVNRETGIVTDEFLEDKVSALILLRQFGYINEFAANAKNLPERGSFIFYLKSIAYLDVQNFEKSEIYAQKAMSAEEGAIEPILVRIVALNALGKYQEAVKLEKDLEKFDEGDYKTLFSKATAYNILGDFSSFNKDFGKSAYFYQKVYDDTSYFDPEEDKALISAKLANAYRLSGDLDNSKKYLDKAMSYAEKPDNSSDVKKAVQYIYKADS